MERPAKLKRLASQRTMLAHAVRGLDDDIEALVLELESVKYTIAELRRSQELKPTDPRYDELQAEVAGYDAEIEAARTRRHEAANDLQALTVTVTHLEAWCKTHGIGVRLREVSQ